MLKWTSFHLVRIYGADGFHSTLNWRPHISKASMHSVAIVKKVLGFCSNGRSPIPAILLDYRFRKIFDLRGSSKSTPNFL